MARARPCLDNGANPNAADARGFTSLHRAAEMGQIDMVRTLIASGAKADVEVDGHTPASLAEAGEYQDIVRVLTEAASG